MKYTTEKDKESIKNQFKSLLAANGMSLKNFCDKHKLKYTRIQQQITRYDINHENITKLIKLVDKKKELIRTRDGLKIKAIKMSYLSFKEVKNIITNQSTYVEENKDEELLLRMENSNYLCITFDGNDIVQYETLNKDDDPVTFNFKPFHNEKIETLLNICFFTQEEAQDNRTQEEIDGFIHDTI